jgi:hypothetical protein
MSMDPNLRTLAIRAHRGEFPTPNQRSPILRIWASGSELAGFMRSFADYQKYMKESFGVETESVAEGDVIFLSDGPVAVQVTCVRTAAVDAWFLKK